MISSRKSLKTAVIGRKQKITIKKAVIKSAIKKSASFKKILSSDLNKTIHSLGKKYKKQTIELDTRNKQLKHGADKQQRAEEQIHIRTKAMEATTDAIFIIDAIKPDFSVIYVNQSFYAMTGFHKREILGHNYFQHFGPLSDPRVIEDIKQTILQGKSFHGEMLHFKKNGEKYWNLLRIAPVRDAKGTVTHYVGIKTDVSVMRQRDLEIKDQREELLHVTRVGKLAEFVSSLAHEISQPLTAILSYSQAAVRMLGEREPQIKEILQYIISDDQRAAQVIRRLRALLKKSEPEMKPLDMNSLINETLAFISTDAAVRNNILKINLDPHLAHIQGDRIQLQQVILNLISNSFDAMEQKEGLGELLISTSMQSADTILVEVKDSGCGIPVENMPKLFEHFFTSKPDGLGMGLSISRSIVEAHGGHLNGKNNLDQGVTFSFTLPVFVKERV